MSAVAVVPAAGSSRRMGRDKLLLPWGDTVVIGAVLEALAAGGVEQTIIVRSSGNVALAAWARRHAQQTVVNPAPEGGMLSSVVAGLEALGGAAAMAARGDLLLVCPGDMPGIDAETVGKLIGRIEQGAAIALPAHGNRRGHPLAISAPLVAEIPSLDTNVGLRQLLLRHADRLVELQTGHAGVVQDLDTPADYDAALHEREGLDVKKR